MLKKYFNWSIVSCLFGLWIVIWGLISAEPLGFVGFLIVLGAALLLAIHKTREVFWLFLALIPIETISLSPLQLPFDLRAYQMLGLLLAIVLIYRWISKKENSKLFNLQGYILGKNPSLKKTFSNIKFTDRLLILLAVFSFAGAWWNAPEKEVSIKLSIILVSFLALYFLTKSFLKKNTHKLEGIWFFLLGAKVVFLFSLYQALAIRFGWKSFVIMNGRINSTFPEADWLGMYLALIIALLLWGELSIGHFGKPLNICKTDFQKFLRLLIDAGLFLGIFFLILTVSRSAWVALAASLITFFLLAVAMTYRNNIFNLDKNRLAKGVLVFFFIITAAILIVDYSNLSNFHLLNRAESSISGKQKITVSCKGKQRPPIEIQSIDQLSTIDCRHIDLEIIASEKKLGNSIYEIYRPDPNIEIRKEIYGKTIHAIKDHPVIGQGLGSSAVLLGKDNRGEGLNTSNIFLEVLLSTGAIGLIWFLVIIFSPIITSLKGYFNETDPIILRKRNFIILSTVAVIIPNLFNAGLLLGFFWVWLAVITKLREEII